MHNTATVLPLVAIKFAPVFCFKVILLSYLSFMKKIDQALKQPRFKWLPKHLNHIAENIVFNKRNISFLAINALLRSKELQVAKAPNPFKGSYIAKGFVSLQQGDQLRTVEEELFVIFRLDKHSNIIVITAYSQSDEQ